MVFVMRTEISIKNKNTKMALKVLVKGQMLDRYSKSHLNVNVEVWVHYFFFGKLLRLRCVGSYRLTGYYPLQRMMMCYETFKKLVWLYGYALRISNNVDIIFICYF